MGKKSNDPEARLIESIIDILSHYPCPEECHAYCCKMQPIDLDGHDRKRLKHQLKTTDVDIAVSKKGGRVIHTLDYPCVFLQNDDKCLVYSRRPDKCRTYPFSIGPNLGALVFPCLLGTKLYKDIITFLVDEFGGIIPPNTFDELEKSSVIFYEDPDEPSFVPGVEEWQIHAYRDSLK